MFRLQIASSQIANISGEGANELVERPSLPTLMKTRRMFCGGM